MNRSGFVVLALAGLGIVWGLFRWLEGEAGSAAGGEDAVMRKRVEQRVRGRAAMPPGERPGAVPLAAGIGPEHAGEAREFLPLDAAGRAALKEMIRRFGKAEADEKVELLAEMGTLAYGRELLPFLHGLLTTEPEAEVRLAALELLAGNTTEEILPLLRVGLVDADEDVRLRSVLAAAHVSGELDVFLAEVFGHAEENTRLAGLDILEHQPVTSRVRGLGLAMDSGRRELQLAAVGQLQFESNHQAVEALLRHVEAADEEVREGVRFTLRFLLEEDFESVAAGRAWWQAHKREFDAELIRH